MNLLPPAGCLYCCIGLIIQPASALSRARTLNRYLRHQNAVTKKHAAFREITNFYEKTVPLVTPYMRLFVAVRETCRGTSNSGGDGSTNRHSPPHFAD